MATNKRELHINDYLDLNNDIINYIKSEVEYIISTWKDNFKHIYVYINKCHKFAIDGHNNPIIYDIKIEIESADLDSINPIQTMTIYASKERIEKNINTN